MAIRRGASRGVPVKMPTKKRARPSFQQILHLLHRALIFAAAISYIKLSFDSAVAAVGLLRGRDDPHLPTDDRTYPLMGEFVGRATLRESRLVTQVLANNTAPLNGTLYLHASTDASFTPCPTMPEVYADAFVRSVYSAIVRDASYHLTDLADANMELIVPVVDCASFDVVAGNTVSGRFFYLARERRDPTNVNVIVASLSNQPYEIVAQGEKGTAAVGIVQSLHDMRTRPKVTHYIASIGYPFEDFRFREYEYLNTTKNGLWTLQHVPPDDTEIVYVMTTASRDGFYIKAESEQSNIKVQVWEAETDPVACVSRWRWITKPVISDSWAWVHAVQALIGLGLLSSLVILCLATFRNIHAGKWWVGDAFVSISTAQLVNGAAVLISWFMNEYWVLHEFSFSIGYEVSGVTQIFIDTAPVQAGMLTLYLSACGLLGRVFREKIDPFFAMVCYEIGFELKIRILRAIPALRSSISAYAEYSYLRAIPEDVDGQLEISPMRMWTTHPIGTRNYGFVFRCLFPIYASLLLVLVYIAIRKIYRRMHPESVYRVQHSTRVHSSHNEDSLVAQKRVLTFFEIATGAELENRFGVVSDYETCLFIKGMKFASADGIYSTGFVIANKKYLLQTDDYWSIVLMKLVRRRYRNIFVYEVNGSTVQQTARLVYPHTLTLHDIAMVNVSVLS